MIKIERDYPITPKDKLFAASIIIGVTLYVYGTFTSKNPVFYVEGGKILIYLGIGLFVIDRFIKLMKKE